MPDPLPVLPITSTFTPDDAAALAGVVRGAFAAKTPLYPIGGGTALDYGLPAKAQGIGLSTASLTRVVDYPARDMTITVEAGITMTALAEILAAEGQQLPIDVPFPDRATLGGVIATNWSGPRRYGHGTIRDYVIGISAVDGRGVAFKAGGRVVKNVAGYDFCKLLTGSLGTLAVITQVTLKVKPIPVASTWVVCDARESSNFCLFLMMAGAGASPAAIEWVGGSRWLSHPLPGGNVREQGASLAMLLEGSQAEVDWQLERLAAARTERPGVFRDVETRQVDDGAAVKEMLDVLTAFPAERTAPLTVRFNLPPGDVNIIEFHLERAGGRCSYQSHRGNGILNVHFEEVAAADVSRLILKDLQPLAAKYGGNVIVLSCPGQELTRQLTWGVGRSDRQVMAAVKRQFDPANILNPDRFVY
jgi:glycolate oxidase FAD binding subunit